MIYPIIVYGDPILRKVAQPVEKIEDLDRKFLDDLWETMYFSDGVGLAAPQIGKSIRIFVIDASTGADIEPELKNFKKAFINPQIIEKYGEDKTMNEGCLSLPEIREDVIRPESVKIKYLDEEFIEHEVIFKGFAARIIQHEYDHLEGKLLVDYLTPLRRRLLKSKLNNILKGKVETHYRIKIPAK